METTVKRLALYIASDARLRNPNNPSPHGGKMNDKPYKIITSITLMLLGISIIILAFKLADVQTQLAEIQAACAEGK